eukprot:7817729-Ditylum_brightwellii.AAC.1
MPLHIQEDNNKTPTQTTLTLQIIGTATACPYAAVTTLEDSYKALSLEITTGESPQGTSHVLCTHKVL